MPTVTSVPFLAEWTDVGAPTLLMDWSELPARPKIILACLVNQGPVPVTMVLETAEIPGFSDDEKASGQVVAAGKQGSFEIGPGATRTYFRLTAHTDPVDAVFPTATVKWKLQVWVSGEGRGR